VRASHNKQTAARGRVESTPANRNKKRNERSLRLQQLNFKQFVHNGHLVNSASALMRRRAIPRVSFARGWRDAENRDEVRKNFPRDRAITGSGGEKKGEWKGERRAPLNSPSRTRRFFVSLLAASVLPFSFYRHNISLRPIKVACAA